MSLFITRIFSVILLLNFTSALFGASLTGRVFVKNTDGNVFVVPSAIEIGEAISLKIGGNNLESAKVRFSQPHNGNEIIYAVFTNLPHSMGMIALVMRGLTTENGGMNGDFYVKQFKTAPTSADLDLLLDRVQANQTQDLVYESAFSFSSDEAISNGIEKVLLGRTRGRLVYARMVYAAENPSQLIGCWTNAGVGRNAEYYQGSCPVKGARYWELSANGQVMTAAGFERGIPYSWSRAGQLQSLLIGAERTRAFNDAYLQYARPNFYGWGFFYLFPWQIVL
jgi:hypothetical protein